MFVQLVNFPEYLEVTEVKAETGMHLEVPNPSVTDVATLTLPQSVELIPAVS